jgi:hypothetical protein
MGFAQIPLQIATATMAALAVGIGGCPGADRGLSRLNVRSLKA